MIDTILSLQVAEMMFDLLVDKGTRLDIRNRFGLTPLTLAAKLGRKDVMK